MKVWKVLLLVWVALCATIVTSLYKNGFWDSWPDKRAEVKAAFMEVLQGSPNQAATIDFFAECVTTELIRIAVKYDCPIHFQTPAEKDLEACINPAHQEEAQKAMNGCIDSTLTKFGPLQ